MADQEEPKQPKKPPEKSADMIPIRDLFNIQETMNDMFSELFSGRQPRSAAPDSWSPQVDIYETKEAIYILMGIPGMTPKDLDITATPENLIIKGEKKSLRNVDDQDYILREHFYGTFTRSIPLPCPVKAREIKASYKDGMLELRLPKTKTGKGKSVRIELD